MATPHADQSPASAQPGRDRPGRDQPASAQPGSDQPDSDQSGRDQPIADERSRRTLLDSRVVYHGRIWNVEQDRFALTPGSAPLVRDYIVHPGAVAVVALNDQGQVLMLRQYRHPVRMDLWEIPAGLLDVEGEDCRVAAARELAEEADLTADRWDVLADLFTSPGSSSEAIRIYLARGLGEVPEGQRHMRTDEEAEIQLRWVNLSDAVAAVLEGRIHNPSAVSGVLAAVAAERDGFSSLRPGDAAWPEHPSNRLQDLPDDAGPPER